MISRGETKSEKTDKNNKAIKTSLTENKDNESERLKYDEGKQQKKKKKKKINDTAGNNIHPNDKMPGNSS